MSRLHKARSVRELAIVRLDARPMRDNEFDLSAASANQSRPTGGSNTLAMGLQQPQHQQQSIHTAQAQPPTKPIILRSGDGSLHNRYSSVDVLPGSFSIAQQQQPKQSGKTPPPRPSQPPRVVQSRPAAQPQQVVALYDLLEPPEPGILPMRRGDRIEVLRREDNNWYFGRHANTGVTGLVPREYVGEASSASQQPPSAPVSNFQAEIDRAWEQSDNENRQSDGQIHYRQKPTQRPEVKQRASLTAAAQQQLAEAGAAAAAAAAAAASSSSTVSAPKPAAQQPPKPKPKPIGGAPTARALHAFESTHPGDLNFSANQIITHIREVNDEWMEGRLASTDRVGLFPSSYVQLLQQKPPPPPKPKPKPATKPAQSPTTQKPTQSPSKFLYTAEATHDFPAQQAGDLALRAGDKVGVTEELPGGEWLRGRLLDQPEEGIFPITFVKKLSPEIQQPTGSSPNSPAKRRQLGSVSTGAGRTARAVYDFVGRAEDELTFNAGDIVTAVSEVNAEWLAGTVRGRAGGPVRGIFPKAFVQLL